MPKLSVKKRLLKIAGNYELYLFLLPALLYFLIFCYGPMYGLQIAFKDFRAGLTIASSRWVGFKHFTRFLNGPNISSLIRNTLLISAGTLFLGFPLSVIWALVLNELPFPRLKKTTQVVAYVPHFISTVVMASMIIIFLNANHGLVNRFLGLFGVPHHDFMTVAPWFPWIYILSDVWQQTGWNAIIYISALSGIDPQQHEAAMIDGASRLQRIWHVNIPGILPTVTIMFIMAAGRVMSVGFEKVFLLQNNLNLPYSELVSTYVYKVGLLQVQYSFSSAVGLFNSVINFVLLLLVNGISRKLGDNGLW